MKIGKCMSRDKYAAVRRRQRRHDFELGCERFAEMVNTKRDDTMIYPLRQQALIAGRQCGKTNIVQDVLTSPEFIKGLTDKKVDLK